MKLPGYKIINKRRKTGDTLVLVPVYNEMPHLGDIINTIRLCWDGDILAVDDCSTDGSLDILRAISTINVISNNSNCGAGGVLLQGFGYALERRFKNVITLDADGQHSPFLIKDFITAIEPHCCGKCRCKKHYDFIWGSRYLSGYKKLSLSFQARQEVNKIITNRLNDLTDYKLTDAFCGYRAYRTSALKKLHLTEIGYGMFMQMTIQAAHMGISIREIPVPLVYIDETRDFQGQFENVKKRLDYYNGVIDRELKVGQNFSC